MELEQGISQIYQSDFSARQAYIAGRLEEQIRYYDTKSQRNKKLYYRLSILSIAANALIPIISVYISTPNVVAKTAITCLSSATAVVSSCLMVLNSKNLWLKYRRNASLLTSLLHQFYAQAGVFSGLGEQEAFARLVQQSEEVFNLENEGWGSLFEKEQREEREI